MRASCSCLLVTQLNLGRNSLKFVTKGFIRFRASVDKSSGMVVIFVEDSGPGVPMEKRNKLFNKFQESLDSLHQGTGYVGSHVG